MDRFVWIDSLKNTFNQPSLRLKNILSHFCKNLGAGLRDNVLIWVYDYYGYDLLIRPP